MLKACLRPNCVSKIGDLKCDITHEFDAASTVNGAKPRGLERLIAAKYALIHSRLLLNNNRPN